ncbi:MAG TPA: hypothetical protein VEI08_00625 [Candidatus Bathyarchaeia archaeon]|nr:hypothetical protein [Candidatus Bathyarchaeia archaeon]
MLGSPAFRTFFSTIIPIAVGLFSGTLVIEITTPKGLAWDLFYKTFSFYALLAVSLGAYWYNRQLYVYEVEVQRFLDADYCVAYMRSKCLPEAAERYKELIRNGAGGELLQAMEELRRILR